MAISSGVRCAVMLLVATGTQYGRVQAQAGLHMPFVRDSQTLGKPKEDLSKVTLERTCQFTLSITGAAIADVKDWKFALGDSIKMLGPLAGNQAADFVAKVPKGTDSTLKLTLTGAPPPAIMSLGTVELRVRDLAPQEKCSSGGEPATPPAGPTRRSTRGYPPVYNRSGRMANLRFNSFGLPDTTARGTPEKFPAGITDNDAITVFIDIPDTVKVSEYSVQVTGNIKGEEVNIIGQGDLAKLPELGIIQGAEAQVVGSSVYSMGTFGPYSAPQVTIRIVRLVEGKTLVDRSYTLRVRRTYISALRIGVARTGVRFGDFQAGPRSGSDTTRIIRDLSQRRDREVRPYLMLVFYGWRFWERGFWDGRDVEAEPSTEERLNPMVGAGLKKLGDEWLLGLSFEVARGLDVNAAYQAAKVSVLQSGFHVDSVFTGTGRPPTSKEWKSGVTIGASLDLRVAVSVMSGLLSSNK